MTAVADAPVQNWGWQSPVPYLFGGLAAMFGLVAVALLILACSNHCMKLIGSLQYFTAQRDLEAGGDNDSKPAPVFQEKFVVVMAGEAKPTCLATPMSSRTSWSGSYKTSSEQ